jgi:predicted O-methyltransferase YrrM
VFADDGQCAYTDQQFHLLRVPSDLKGRAYRIEGYDCGVLHFQFVNWRNLVIKQAWYRCLEHIMNPEKPIDEINRLYAPSKDEKGINLLPANPDWFRYYVFFDAETFQESDSWREEQVKSWFRQYGRDYFAGLDIWDIDWDEENRRAAPELKRELPGLVADHMTVEEVEMLRQIDPIGGWMSLTELLVLYRLVKALPNDARILEIGSYRGRSTNAIGHAIKQSAKLVYCLDIWQDFDKQGILAQDAKQNSLPPGEFGVFRDFLQNTSWFSPQLIVQKASVKQVSDFLPQHYFDLIFIDGAHDYENVARDIETSIPCLKPDGIICGHDYREEGGQDVIQAVQKRVFDNTQSRDHGIFTGTSIWYAQIQGREKAPERIEVLQPSDTLPAPSNCVVSAIVSTFNAERFLAGCLDDLERQTIADQMEIIVINSGSEQNEDKIVRE